MLGYQDSNLESQDQNLKCYHYTIAQSFRPQRYNYFVYCKKNDGVFLVEILPPEAKR